MHKLTVKLPPFSPDYSGVCSALFELGGLLLIHDASGCTGNYTGYDEPRWYGSDSKVFCTALREIDAVLGNDDKLIEKVLEAAEALSPGFIGLMGSPVPTVIGADLQGIATEIESRSGIPSFGFSTTGLQLYDWGVSEALLALSRRFLRPCGTKKRGTINLLGVTPLDFGIKDLLPHMKGELEARGLAVSACFAMGSSLDELAESASASVNVVLSAGGYGLARYLFSRFGTPFVVGQPLDGFLADDLCLMIDRAEETGEPQIPEPATSENGEILLIGEHVTMHSLARRISMELGKTVHIGCPFRRLGEISGPGTFDLPSERSIEEALAGGYGSVFGDPLYRGLMKGGGNYVEVPHVAVSSKLYWNDPSPILGDGLIHLLKGAVLS